MDEIMKTTEFDKFVDLIRKRAWEYSKKWGIEYSEMESQGYLIYCECLEKFDSNKARFSTYVAYPSAYPLNENRFLIGFVIHDVEYRF